MTDTITIKGLVATTPRSITTSDGLHITSFRLASSQRRYDRASQRWLDNDTNWYTISSFRDLAKHIAESVKKGDRVILTGRLRIRDWENTDRSGTTVEVEASNEEVLVSIDADVRLTNDAINKAVTLMHGARLDFVSPYPRQIAQSFAERLIQPLLQWSWLTTVPLRYAEGARQKSMAVANGQFFVVRRSALDSVGGYQSVKHAVIDDVFLARALMASGSSGTVINGSDIAETRMYTSWSEIEAGYGKSLNKAFGSLVGAIFVISFLFATSIAPLVLGLLGNPYGWLGFAAIVGTRVLSAIKSRGRVLDSVLHPISIVALIYLIVYSYLVRKTVMWKGRTV